MKLNSDLEYLFDQAQIRILEALERHGQFSAFALVLTGEGGSELVEDPNPSGGIRNSVKRLMDALLPRATSGEISASAICTWAPGADFGMDLDAAVFYLEHEEHISAIAMLPYRKDDKLGWSFAQGEIGAQKARLFAARLRTEPLEITHPEFELSLDEGWQQLAGDDPEQFSFHSAGRRTSVVLSVAMHAVSKDRLSDMANKMAEARVQAEQEARAGRTVELTSCNVGLEQDGHVGRVVYVGYDEYGIFRFNGWVTQRKALSLWISIAGHDNEYSKAMFEEVFQRLRFYVP